MYAHTPVAWELDPLLRGVKKHSWSLEPITSTTPDEKTTSNTDTAKDIDATMRVQVRRCRRLLQNVCGKSVSKQ